MLPTDLEPISVNTPRVAILWLLPSFLQVDEGVIHPRDLAQASKGPAGHSGCQGGALELSLRCPVPKSPFLSSHFRDQQALSRSTPPHAPKSLCMAWAGSMMVNTVLIPSTIGSVVQFWGMEETFSHVGPSPEFISPAVPDPRDPTQHLPVQCCDPQGCPREHWPRSCSAGRWAGCH